MAQKTIGKISDTILNAIASSYVIKSKVLLMLVNANIQVTV